LAGIPSSHPDNLYIALAHQLLLGSNTFDRPPDVLIPLIRDKLYEFLEDNPTYDSTLIGTIQSVCDCFAINVIVYTADDRYIFQPSNSSEIYSTVFLYSKPPNYSFDSVFQTVVNVPFRNLTSLVSRAFLRMSTWNVRGVTDNIKRNIVDFELINKKIWVCAIQESHLWSQRLSTANYQWMLGHQSQSRASRGLGFIVHRSIVHYITDVRFPTSNIGILTIKFPNISRPLYFVNVHKCSEGDVNSSLECGNTNNLFLLIA
jgi:hypothetical protein